MKAHAGERLVVKATHLDEPVRDGRILEVHGRDGGPPYLVEWSDNGHVSLIYPGSDAFVDHLGEHGADEDESSRAASSASPPAGTA